MDFLCFSILSHLRPLSSFKDSFKLIFLCKIIYAWFCLWFSFTSFRLEKACPPYTLCRRSKKNLCAGLLSKMTLYKIWWIKHLFFSNSLKFIYLQCYCTHWEFSVVMEMFTKTVLFFSGFSVMFCNVSKHIIQKNPRALISKKISGGFDAS